MKKSVIGSQLGKGTKSSIRIRSQHRLLTTKEASEFLQVSVPTIYDWVYKRKIPYRKHGRLLRFCKEELIEWGMSGC